MEIAHLTAEHPRLYHMAEGDSWPSIRSRGLLSTQAIVDLYQPEPRIRSAILTAVRRTSVTLHSVELGSVRIRDQLPLKFLDRCLTPGTTPQQFLEALNGRVFFWLTKARLLSLLNARQYRMARQTVLTIDTEELISAYVERVELAPYNTGSMHVPTAPARGVNVFTHIADYPYESWRAKRGRRADAAVELTIPYSVPDIVKYILTAEVWEHGRATQTLFRR